MKLRSEEDNVKLANKLMGIYRSFILSVLRQNLPIFQIRYLTLRKEGVCDREIPKRTLRNEKRHFGVVKRKPRVLITSIPHHFNFRPNAANRIFKCEHSPNKCAGIISQLQPIKANLLPRGIVSGNRDTPQKRFQSRENITTHKRTIQQGGPVLPEISPLLPYPGRPNRPSFPFNYGAALSVRPLSVQRLGEME